MWFRLQTCLVLIPLPYEDSRNGEKGLGSNKSEKLFIYLALAKPALPGQFVLLVSSQSKENASKYFCLFQCTAQNKSSDFWAAQKYFCVCEQHKFLLFVSLIAQNWLRKGSTNLITEQHKMLDFLNGVVHFLSFLCRSSPGFDARMDIP